MNSSTVLRNRLATGQPPLLLPGAPNALTARLLEDCEFEAVYVSGAAISNTYLGVPDIGLLTLSQLADHVRVIRDAVSVPLVVDGDTGFGNPIGVYRTVRLLETAGADAIQIEDQVDPKRCGHFPDKAVIPTADMVQKIKAAADARTDDDVQIIARTDARGVTDLDEACDRAAQYLAAGADVAFVEAPRSSDELAEIPRRVPGCHVANMVEGGLTPILPLAELASYGFSIVLYANSALRAAIAGMRGVLTHLHHHGDTTLVTDAIATWNERQSLVRKDLYDVMSVKYATNGPTEQHSQRPAQHERNDR